MRVHLTTAIAAGVGFGAISFFLAWIALRRGGTSACWDRRRWWGRLARAVTDLAPSGQVEVRGEIWRAVAFPAASAIPAGAAVVVDRIEGLTLIVSQTR